MYTKFSESRNWSVNLVDLNEGTSGGYKEIIFEVNGEDVYGNLKFEAGVHRVQRVPQTCLLYTSPSPRDATLSRMPSSA